MHIAECLFLSFDGICPVKNDVSGAILKWNQSGHSRGTALCILLLEFFECLDWAK